MRLASKSAAVAVVLAAALTSDAWAKRSGPGKVAPVIHNGVKYVAPNLNGREGRVEALDPKTDEKLWEKVFYTVKIDPNLEADVQWVFITTLSIHDGKLLVTNEKGEQYTLDPKTRTVEKRKEDGPARGQSSPTLSSVSEPTNAGWGPDVKLSTNEVSAALNENMGPCIVTSGNMVYVVWTDLKNNGQAVYFKRSSDSGKTWEPDRRISGSPSAEQWPLLAVSGNTLHLVFLRDFGTDKSASYYKRSADGGKSWGPDVLLGKTKWWPGIAAAGPTVYVSLNTLVDVTNSEVFFRRSLDNGATWEARQQISHAPGRSEDPAIAADGKCVYVVWNDNRDGKMEVYFRRSSDEGKTWGPEAALTHAPAYTYMPTICATGATLDVAYGDRQDRIYNIHYLRSVDGGATWVSPQQLTRTTTGALYPFLVRSGPHVQAVCFTIGPAGALMYLHSGNGGDRWDSPVSLVGGTSPSQPFIAVNGETTHLIWKDMRDGHGAIYYKRKSDKK